MKKIIGILLVSLTAAVLSGCIKEVFPEDGTVTTDQVDNTSTEIRARGLHAWMNKLNVLGYTDGADHNDFGYPSLIIRREMMGQDALHPYAYYDWWGAWRRIQYLGPDYANTQMPWRWYYRMIEMANGIIGTFSGVDVQNIPESERAGLGSAYAYRAFAYFDLVRLYQQGRYIDNPDGLTVPIVTDATTIDQIKNNPRAKAEDVYKFILEDLDKAEECLRDYYNSGTLPDYSVVMGMYARLYLEMGNWTLAGQYAAEAKEGFRPLTESEWTDHTTGFNSPTDAWMWWLSLTSNDDVVKTSIITWTSHMANEAGFGYTGGGGTFVAINSHLYSLIPASDFRRKSFVNRSPGEDPVDSEFPWVDYIPEYGSLKFRVGSGNFSTYSVGNAVSVPLMRVEEMILIEAEAAGRLSVADGVTKLNDFVRTYRNPDYALATTDPDEFVEEIWLQRRIELWGEGFSPFDLKRLNKPVIRSFAGTNYMRGERFNTDAAPSWLDLVIPRAEINSNDGITQEQNNPTPSSPADSPEHVW